MRLFKYKELFRVLIKNEYYKKGYSSDFTIKPSQNCIQLLKNHSLKFKAIPYGFAVFGEVEQDGGDEKLIRGFLEDTRLTFLLKLNNPFFINFTDVPVKTVPHEVLYFNNLDNHETGGELLLINKEEIPKTSSNSARIILSPEVYKYNYSGSGDDKTATVTFIDDGFSIEQIVENDNGDFRFQFDLSNYHPGRCEFSVEGETENFYAANEIYRESIFGIVEVFVKSSVPASYQFVDTDDVVTAKEYIIPFTNRSTIWRYLVYDKMTNKLKDPEIDMSGVGFNLESIPATNYPEDYALFTFTSGEDGAPATEKALPLKEESVLNITLSGKINGSKKDLVDHLPNPDVRLIKPDPAEISKIYSDIIIYV